jgi:SAM-dependent methyltransferase
MFRNSNLKRTEFRDRGVNPNHSSVISMSNDYRISHAAIDAGTNYNKTYDSGYYAALWTKIEKPQLETILREVGGPYKKCLDFACGTGRITNVAADYFAEVIGVDVSESMLACARVPDNVRLRRIDLTQETFDETFDTITAFRFFLNAEERLRVETLHVMREHLNDAGWLICNIQMNATSPSGIASRIANRMPWSQARNTMSIDGFNTLLTSNGFAIEQITAYGYLPRPGNRLPGLCEAWLEPVERIAAVLKIPARFAQQFLAVAKKR